MGVADKEEREGKGSKCDTVTPLLQAAYHIQYVIYVAKMIKKLHKYRLQTCQFNVPNLFTRSSIKYAIQYYIQITVLHNGIGLDKKESA